MTGRLRDVLTVLLGLALVVAPAGAVAATSAAFVALESPEPPVGAEDQATPRPASPQSHEPARSAAGETPRAAAAAARPSTRSVEDPVPRHVRLCVWRE